nr:chitinase N-terminal domain-containing protein [uncultured Deefgea sp.]
MKVIGSIFLLVSAAAQAGFLISSSEAEKREQLACRPSMILAMMECEALPAPAAPKGNDPAIRPAEFVPNSGSDMGAIIDSTPIQPFLDPVPARIKADPFTLSWNIGFGDAGSWWELWDNNQLRYRGRDFVPRSLNGNINPVKKLNASSTAVIAQTNIEAVQGGVFTIAQLEPGLHKWLVRLCNGTLEKPKCSESSAETWVDIGPIDADRPKIERPDIPQLAWTPPVTTDGSALIRWNIYWGNTGKVWEVLNNGKAIFRSAKFTDETDKSQEGQVELPLINGTHQLSVRLCAETLCSESDKVTVDAMLGPDIAPAVPVVKVHTSNDPELGTGLPIGQVIVSWQTTSPTVAPDHWLLIDANQRQVLLSQKITKACSPGVWCGSWQGIPTARPANWMVKLCRAKQCVDSEIFEVPSE